MVISLIDKTPIYRSGVSFLLKKELSEDTVVMEYESFFSFKKSRASVQFDLIILAIEQLSEMLIMPNLYEAKRSFPNAGLIVIGKGIHPDSIVEYLSVGVSGYLDNEAGLDELKKCIKDVSAGKKFISEGLFWKLLNIEHRNKRKPRQSMLKK